MAPSPRDVAIPNSVATTARMSMALPTGPSTRSPSSGWNSDRIVIGSSSRNPT
jgi:hypothetical protein